MNGWLLRARWWQIGLLSAPTLGVGIALVSRSVRGQSWIEALVLGVVAGVLCACIVGAVTACRLREGAGAMPPETYAGVDRATRRGPVPEDPEERTAAHRLLAYRLTRIRETQVRSRVGQVVVAVVGAALALGSSPWWWLVVALAVVLLVASPLLVRRLERRAELLAEPPS